MIMSNHDRLGTTIIDELRLCFTAEPEFLQTLSLINLGERLDLENFSIIRTISDHFRYYYMVLNKEHHIVAYFYFGRNGDYDSNYFCVKVENKILYNQPQLIDVLNDIQTSFPIDFNNISKLDITQDYTKNIAYTILRLIHNKYLKTIINGRVIKE